MGVRFACFLKHPFLTLVEINWCCVNYYMYNKKYNDCRFY